MKFLLTFLAVATVAFANDVDPDVEVLTTGNFASYIKEGTTLVEFYAPWCGHCQKLTPEYGKAATILKKFGVRLGKVDATVEADLAGRFDVSGYPTLKIFRDGELAGPYEGPRDAAGIVAYMKKQNGPAARAFATLQDVKDETVTLGGTIFALVSKTGDSPLAKAFAAAAAKEREAFEFAVVTDPSVSEDRIVRLFPTDLPRYQGETQELAYTGAASADEVVNWLFTAALPLAGINDAETAAIYDRVSKPVATLYIQHVDPVYDRSGTKYYLNRIRKVAAAYPGLVFALAAYGSAPFELVTGAGYNLGIRGEAGQKYRFENPSKKFDKADLEAFVKAYLDGQVEEFLKSEPVPAEQGDVKTLVAKNFAAETSGKAGLLEFYAPWCGHCKSLAPIWDKLGEKAAKEAPAVVIGKMDATANDVPAGFEVRGYPTIIYQSADGSREPYNGARELNDFVKFLKGKGVWRK